MLRHYIKELFDPLASVTPLAALVGIVLAYRYVYVSLISALLILFAMLFANMSVNVLNDYEDFKKGTDIDAVHTKFSGGRAAMLVSGDIKPKPTFILGIITFLLAISIGAVFIIKYPLLLPIVLLGALAILLYAKLFVDIPFFSEILLAIIYTFVPLGGFIASGGPVGKIANVLFVAVPVGILVSMVLVINEVPDRETDKKHGRKSTVVIVNDVNKIAKIYLAMQIAAVAIIAFGVVAGFLDATALLPIAAFPLMLKAYSGISAYKNPKDFESYMGADVAYFLLFSFLLILGIAI